MSKQDYDKLHIELAQKYGTTDSVIHSIRSVYSNTENKTSEKILAWAVAKSTQPAKRTGKPRLNHRRKNIQHYKNIRALLLRLKNDEFNEIIKNI